MTQHAMTPESEARLKGRMTCAGADKNDRACHVSELLTSVGFELVTAGWPFVGAFACKQAILYKWMAAAGRWDQENQAVSDAIMRYQTISSAIRRISC